MSVLLKIFEKKKPLITYITAGDPDLRTTKKMIFDLEKAGADIIELGVPFSDPLADGPVIQASHQRALASGTSLIKIITLLKEIKPKFHTPIVLMGAVYLFLAYGLKQFFADAQAVGVCGLIIPDLPPEEAGDFIYLSKKHQVDLIFLVSTASPTTRLKIITEAGTSFIYLMSTKGLTGVRKTMDWSALKSQIAKIKEFTTRPIAVGFGVSTTEQMQGLLKIADGVIIGSAIVEKALDSRHQAIKFVKKLVQKGRE